MEHKRFLGIKKWQIKVHYENGDMRNYTNQKMNYTFQYDNVFFKMIDFSRLSVAKFLLTEDKKVWPTFELIYNTDLMFRSILERLWVLILSA